jgi:hypothetical protein
VDGIGRSCEPSTARIRGRVTGTRRPPRVTEPPPWPCRVAVHSGSWRPWVRVQRSHLASMIAAIACSPVPTATASRPSRISPASSASARSPCPALRAGSCRKAVPRHGVLGGSPEYLPHGRTQGDHHLKFTSSGTTSRAAVGGRASEGSAGAHRARHSLDHLGHVLVRHPSDAASCGGPVCDGGVGGVNTTSE